MSNLFIQNKYYKTYFQLIESRKKLSRSKENVYLEKHHIIPKSLGGSDVESNLILLTAREHFICHLLLTKFVVEELSHKMIYAFWAMCNQDGPNQKRHNANSKLYESFRLKFAQTHSKRMSGKNNPMFGKKPTNVPISGKKHWAYGSDRSLENGCIAAIKLSEKIKNVPKSEEHKKKISISNRKPKVKTPCPHCSVYVDAGNMSRWHGIGKCTN